MLFLQRHLFKNICDILVVNMNKREYVDVFPRMQWEGMICLRDLSVAMVNDINWSTNKLETLDGSALFHL